MDPAVAAAAGGGLLADPPAEVGGVGGRRREAFPEADLLRLVLEGGVRVQVRPSGTEPKVKLYGEAIDADPTPYLDAMLPLLTGEEPVLNPGHRQMTVDLPGTVHAVRNERIRSSWMIRQLQAEGGELVAHRLVMADDAPTDLVAGTVPGLVGALAEVATVPPAVAGFDAEAGGRPGEVDVDHLAGRAASSGMLALRLGQPARG